jgi:putative spermidine/putrescine transport system permease protein
MSVISTTDRPLRRGAGVSATGLILIVVLGIFFLNLAALILGVVLNSFATSWFATPVPAGLTTRWYEYAGELFQLLRVLQTTFVIGAAVVFMSLLIGAPAAYALARRQFPGKRLLMLLFLLPLLVAPITYGLPLATALYQFDLAGTMAGVILANLVPSIPFVIVLLTPFIEQIDENLERAARMCGASTLRVFVKVLIPLMVPGLLAAGLLVLIRVLAMFELTFLTAGPGEQTLVVALYYTVFAAGIRPSQAIDAMAVIYMLTAFIPLVVALRFVDPTQIVARIKQENLR